MRTRNYRSFCQETLTYLDFKYSNIFSYVQYELGRSFPFPSSSIYYQTDIQEIEHVQIYYEILSRSSGSQMRRELARKEPNEWMHNGESYQCRRN